MTEKLTLAENLINTLKPLYLPQSYLAVGSEAANINLPRQERLTLEELEKNNGPGSWDIIHINVRKNFAETRRAFQASLALSHENSIWLIEGTIPGKSWLLPCPSFCRPQKDDAFKTVLSLYRQGEFSYCTPVISGAGLTMLWRAPVERRRIKLPESLKISHFSLRKHLSLLLPVHLKTAPQLVGMALEPTDYRDLRLHLRLFLLAQKSKTKRQEQ